MDGFPSLRGAEDHGADALREAPSPRISDQALSLLRDLSASRGKARIGRRSRALRKLADLGLVAREPSPVDLRCPGWPLTVAGRREVERRRRR